jgi:hypothetical protein
MIKVKTRSQNPLKVCVINEIFSNKYFKKSMNIGSSVALQVYAVSLSKRLEKPIIVPLTI